MANTTGKKFGGRQKGVPNKTTIKVKSALNEAFDKLGGVKAFVKWANTDDDTKKAFYNMWIKIMPQEIKAGGLADSEPIQITLNYPTRKK